MLNGSDSELLGGKDVEGGSCDLILRSILFWHLPGTIEELLIFLVKHECTWFPLYMNVWKCWESKTHKDFSLKVPFVLVSVGCFN
jgi:hypothetical protein